MTLEIGLDPVLLRLGPLQIAWHGLLTAVAVLAGVRLGTERAARLRYASEEVSRIVLWGILGGVVGARLFHVLDHLPQYLADPLSILAIWQGGIAVYGGFAGGLLGGWLAARRSGLAVWPLLDAAAPALLVGQLVGRLGCLVNGDAWGAPTGAAWGLIYRNPGALLPSNLLGVPTQPYPLYESVAVALLLALLVLLERRQPAGSGITFIVAVLGYAVIRFALSPFRQEEAVFAGLQEAQIVAVLTAAVALAMLWIWRPHTRLVPLLHRP